MSSLINSLLYVLFICVTVSNLCNNDCLFDILLCLQPFCKRQHLLVRFIQRRSSNHYYSLQTQRDFTQCRLNSYCLSSALSCLFIVLRQQSNERSWSRIFVLSLSRDFIATSFLFVYCVHIASCCIRLRSVFVIYLFHTHGLCFW